MRRPHSGSRKQQKKEQKERILIVCGAQCSEPYYIHNLLEHHSINSSQVEIHAYAVTPEVAVEKAKNIVKTEKQNGEKFDEVFCVFDRDDFAHFQRAKNAAARVNIVCIESTPSFEYWLLIHFRRSDAPYAAVGNKTVGDLCLHDLKREFRGYEKNHRRMYTELYERLPEAMNYSRRRFQTSLEENDFNPSTNFHVLVERLHKLGNVVI